MTHALHVLDKTDWIYVVENGTIKEQGTYDVSKLWITYPNAPFTHSVTQSLMKDASAFSRLMDEYGSLERQESPKSLKDEALDTKPVDPLHDLVDKQAQAALMQAEERETGAVSSEIYRKYLRFAGGTVWAPIVLALVVLQEGSQGDDRVFISVPRAHFQTLLVGNNLLLAFWTSESINGFGQRDYMALYAGLGVWLCILLRYIYLELISCRHRPRIFLVPPQRYFYVSDSAVVSIKCSCFSSRCSVIGLIAALKLFKAALSHVLRSPMAFFDTTPMGE